MPTHTPQRDDLERLWRRAEEIRSLCGLPPHPRMPAPAAGREIPSLESLVQLLLGDLERNFRRELATRVQLEGLGELMTLPARDAEPGYSYRLLVNYLARAMSEPRLWLGVVDGSPPAFTLYLAGDPAAIDVEAERVHLQWLQPDWLRWIVLGEGEPALWIGPTGSRQGGPWYPMPVPGELALDRLSGEIPICPGALTAKARCALSRAPLEEMAGGHRTCGRCHFRHIVGLLGVEGKAAPARRSALEAVVPSLGAILANLGLKEALDLEARFRDSVIENLPIGVVAVDARGQVVTWNRAAAAIIGVEREIASGSSIGRQAPPHTWQGQLIESLESGTERALAEHALTRADGSARPVEVATSPLRDAEGRIRGAVATLVDLSDVRRMEEQIRHLDRLAALGRFASSVAHELRNPLTGIASGVEYLSRGFPEGDERREGVAFILREVVRLNSIIQDLFAASRPRSLSLGRVSLVEIAERALRSVAPTAEQAGVKLVFESADTWPTVLADADQLQQVLLNLMQNGIQATPPDGTVTVRARRSGTAATPRVDIEVEDTGRGINPGDRSRIFEPFFTTRPKGTGLGLFVAHGIVQRHGGTIEVESKLGRGTRFRIVLPDPT